MHSLRCPHAVGPRRHAFGWKSQPAITRLQKALSEIKLVSRADPMLGAEGAVALLERISPALENVDSSSGAIGTAVNHTIAELVPVIVAAPADTSTRAAWLDRLFDAHGVDQIPYIERLADFWGEHRLRGDAQHGTLPEVGVRDIFIVVCRVFTALHTK